MLPLLNMRFREWVGSLALRSYLIVPLPFVYKRESSWARVTIMNGERTQITHTNTHVMKLDNPSSTDTLLEGPHFSWWEMRGLVKFYLDFSFFFMQGARKRVTSFYYCTPFICWYYPSSWDTVGGKSSHCDVGEERWSNDFPISPSALLEELENELDLLYYVSLNCNLLFVCTIPISEDTVEG